MSEESLDHRLSRLRIDKEKKRTRRRGRFGKWILLLLLLAGGGYGAYIKWTAPVAVRVQRIEAETPTPGKGAPLVTATGYVVPRHKVEVSSKIIGRVKELLVKRGDSVKEGDVLIRIEDEEYQAQVRSAEALVGSLKAQVAELKAGSRPQEIAAAEASVTSAQATLNNAEAEYRRADELTRNGVASSQELDRARTARDVASAQLNSARKNAELIKIGPRREEIEAAEARLREAEANLEYIKTSLENTVIKAPITGTILEKLAEQGELVTNTNFGGARGAKSSVVTMADLTDLQVEVDINQADLSKIKLGRKAEIRLDSDPDHRYAGEVDDISPQADRQKGTVQAKVRILDPDESMKTEVNARVTFLGEAAPDAVADTKPRLWAPKTAMVQRDGQSLIFRVMNDKAVAAPVTAGVETEKGTEILSGLSGGDTIILSPPDSLADGAKITVVQ